MSRTAVHTNSGPSLDYAFRLLRIRPLRPHLEMSESATLPSRKIPWGTTFQGCVSECQWSPDRGLLAALGGKFEEEYMSKQFAGKIAIDIRDSVEDWSPYVPPVAPDNSPNVVYIVLDDVGFAAMSNYGGPIETPNIDRIMNDGVRYTQFHTTALCSPTRSCLLTGRNHTRNSMACITEAAIGFP